jgi:acyl-CoA thioester hydrolase
LSTEFSFPIRVYYEDTDIAGVVYYANYLKFFERGRTEWLRATGVQLSTMAAQDGLTLVVRDARMAFNAPATLDDELTVTSQLTKLGRASIVLAQRCLRGGSVLVEGEIRIGCIDLAARRAAPMPEPVYERLKQLLPNQAQKP